MRYLGGFNSSEFEKFAVCESHLKQMFLPSVVSKYFKSSIIFPFAYGQSSYYLYLLEDVILIAVKNNIQFRWKKSCDENLKKYVLKRYEVLSLQHNLPISPSVKTPIVKL